MNKIDSIFYMYSNMDGRSQILIFLIILVVLMLISIFIINFITKRKEEKIDKQFNSITRYSNIVNKEEKSEKKLVVKEEKEDFEIIEFVHEEDSIEDISKLMEDAEKFDPIDLTKFEEEQEKDAIISYDELVKRAGAKKIVYKAEPKKQEKIEVIPMPEEKKKFKASQIVSPIYGIQKEKNNKEEIETFIDLEDFSFNEKISEQEEMQKDIDFLGTLKTFRSNLD